jgi:hypothetical protein
MAIVHKFELATRGGYSDSTPITCHECGMQMFQWSSQKYGGTKINCFSQSCAKPMPIAMIRGDVEGFCQNEYNIPGNPNVCYPKAEGYSNELREAVKKYLTAWGFTKIGFIEPSKDEKGENQERHTVVTGVHISPKINIMFRKAPKTQRVFVFNNKYGVISTKFCFYERYERSYHAWRDAQYAVSKYCKEIGNDTVHEADKAILMPGREALRKESQDKILESQKEAVLSVIRSRLSKISSLKNDISYQRKEIAEQKEIYLKTFGEPAPKQKGDD